MNDEYSGQSAIYAGMQGPPSWAQGLDLYEWVQVPGNTLASIDPANNPTINPNYPNAAPWKGIVGQAGIIDAFCGACYDDQTGQFGFVNNGGHVDYLGNEPYLCNVIAEQASWRMLRNPSGAVGNVINLNDGQEPTGVYADGRVRSVHSYAYQVAGNGRFFLAGAPALSPSGQSAKAEAYELNTQTGELSLLVAYNDLISPAAVYGAASFDPVRNSLVITGWQASRIIEVDVNAKTKTALTSTENIFAGYVNATYAITPAKHIFCSVQTANTAYKAHRGLAIVEAHTKQVAYPSVPDAPAALGAAFGAVWQDSQRRLLLWNNANNTQTIYTLTPSNPADLSQPWAWGEIVGSGAVPTPRTLNGTHNRWQYSKRLGGCLLLNATNQQMYFVRTD